MMRSIEEPLATAVVRWLPHESGGRPSGPPTAPVYAATCVFPLGGEEEVQPGWPASADQISILLEEVQGPDDGRALYKVGFLVPELARPFLQEGAEVLIMEGPSVVATGILKEVFASDV